MTNESCNRFAKNTEASISAIDAICKYIAAKDALWAISCIVYEIVDGAGI